jgi:hypothetical protein
MPPIVSVKILAGSVAAAADLPGCGHRHRFKARVPDGFLTGLEKRDLQIGKEFDVISCALVQPGERSTRTFPFEFPRGHHSKLLRGNAIAFAQLAPGGF